MSRQKPLRSEGTKNSSSKLEEDLVLNATGGLDPRRGRGVEDLGFGKREKVVGGSGNWYDDAGLLDGGLKSGNGHEDAGLDVLAEAGVSSSDWEASSWILAGSSCGLVLEAIWADEGGQCGH